jgi:hypothetical protein
MDFGSTNLTTFNTIFKLKKKTEKAAPLSSIECMLDVLAGWRVASLE